MFFIPVLPVIDRYGAFFRESVTLRLTTVKRW
jgi:hypothetical protein